MLPEDAIKYLQAAGGTANFRSVAHNLHPGLVFLIDSGLLEHAELDAEGLTCGQLAASAQVQEGALAALLEVMIHFDVLTRRGDRFVLGCEGRLLRRRERLCPGKSTGEPGHRLRSSGHARSISRQAREPAAADPARSSRPGAPATCSNVSPSW